MLRGPLLTPHKIRAERSSNLSFQKLRGAGLTPHFHDERSSNLSEFVPLLASFPSSLSRPAVFLLWHILYFSYAFRPQVLQPGPAVRTRSGVEGLFELLSGYHLTCVAHVLEQTRGCCEGQLPVSVLRVRSLLVSHPQVDTCATKGARSKVQLAVVFFRSLACRGTLKPSLFFSGKAEVCERCWSTHNKCDTALGPCGDAEGDVGRLRL